MLKSLIYHEKIVTTVPKAKELRRFADQMVTLAKANTLASRRRAVGDLMIRFNTLTPKERREAKSGNTSSYNIDRKVIEKLFGVLGPRFQERQGGYTRITRLSETRTGDQGSQCSLEFLSA
jgi:large subunit ribosomal protein L17